MPITEDPGPGHEVHDALACSIFSPSKPMMKPAITPMPLAVIRSTAASSGLRVFCTLRAVSNSPHRGFRCQEHLLETGVMHHPHHLLVIGEVNEASLAKDSPFLLELRISGSSSLALRLLPMKLSSTRKMERRHPRS